MPEARYILRLKEKEPLKIVSNVWEPVAAGARLALTPPPGGARPGRSRCVGSPSALSLGVFVPSGSDAKDQGRRAQFAANFQYGLPIIGSLGPLSAHGHWAGRRRRGSKGGKHSTVIPLTVTQFVRAQRRLADGARARPISASASARTF